MGSFEGYYKGTIEVPFKNGTLSAPAKDTITVLYGFV